MSWRTIHWMLAGVIVGIPLLIVVLYILTLVIGPR
jgi:hypothetical protein